MTLEQLVRDILTQAIKDGLVAPTTENPDPQCRSSGELVGCANLLASGLSGNLVEKMGGWTDIARHEFIGDYRDKFCIFCGEADPGCQCWNDE